MDFSKNPGHNKMEVRSECSRLGLGSMSSKNQEFIPTGIPSLDTILNNGYPLGAVILFEEDELQLHSDLFMKYYLAEGMANNDSIFFASMKDDPWTIIKELPPAVKKSEEIERKQPTGELKIAWRYENAKPVQSSPSLTVNSFSHDFDFNSKTHVHDLSSVRIWPEANNEQTSFNKLFDDICGTIISNGLSFGSESKNTEKQILRICISDFGSPFWPDDKSPLYEFLLKLRTAVHHSSSVALVTIPTQLYDKTVINRCEQVCDIVISLSSLLNSTNTQYKEYCGLLKFLKISPINSLSVHVPEDTEWAFKVKKKRIIIEKMHLPPESSITEQREQDEITSVGRPSCQIQF